MKKNKMRVMPSGVKSLVRKRSIVLGGHKTSVSMEDDFWEALREIAVGRGMALTDLASEVDGGRRVGNLSSVLRLFILEHYRSRLAALAIVGPERVADLAPV